jgi:hypothetical protein
MAPKSMARYLTFQLRLVDREIEGLVHSLGYGATPYPAGLEDTWLREDTWSSWASLHYYLQAREALRAALARPGRQ